MNRQEREEHPGSCPSQGEDRNLLWRNRISGSSLRSGVSLRLQKFLHSDTLPNLPP